MSTTTVKKVNVRTITCTAILGALAFVLMFLDFSVPFAPEFLKMDISDLPALVAAFALGPVPGAMVCVIKNLLHLSITSTVGVGELSNCLLGCAFVLPAGALYRRMKSRKGALLGSLTGACIMAIGSFFTNLLLVYPVYIHVAGFPLEAIMGMYNAIVFFQDVDQLWQALLICNVPFTLIKGILVTIITFLIYKKISPILKGTR